MRLIVSGLLVSGLTLLGGCSTLMPESGGYPLSYTVRDCLKQGSQFIDVWGCVQSRYASGQMGESDRRITAFLKLGDDLAGQVAARKLRDADAKTRLSAGAAELDKI